MRGRVSALLLAILVASVYALPVRRAYRCVGDPPKIATQHGCCPDDDPASDSIGRPCCEKLPAVAVAVGSLAHDDAALSPPLVATMNLSSPPAAIARRVTAFAARRSTGPPPPAPHTIALRI